MCSRIHKNAVLSKTTHGSCEAFTLNNREMGWGQCSLDDSWANQGGSSMKLSVTQSSLESSKSQRGCVPATWVRRRQRHWICIDADHWADPIWKYFRTPNIPLRSTGKFFRTLNRFSLFPAFSYIPRGKEFYSTPDPQAQRQLEMAGENGRARTLQGKLLSLKRSILWSSVPSSDFPDLHHSPL